MSPLRVLAIEDDADLRSFYEAFLTQAGHHVLLASDGLEALALLEQRPDVVLLDLMLPGLDGYGFLERLRATPDHRRIPVIVLSAAAGRRHRVVPGADVFLRKPFEFSTLLRIVARLGRVGQEHRRLS
jgi:DNA-binding response OmpR family regulator